MMAELGYIHVPVQAGGFGQIRAERPPYLVTFDILTWQPPPAPQLRQYEIVQFERDLQEPTRALWLGDGGGTPLAERLKQFRAEAPQLADKQAAVESVARLLVDCHGRGLSLPESEWLAETCAILDAAPAKISTASLKRALSSGNSDS